METPDTVPAEHRRLYESVNAGRRTIKDVAHDVHEIRDEIVETTPRPDGEVVANVMLAYRHLEDASMRLGKALQALDGGVSVYDKATTVGA